MFNVIKVTIHRLINVTISIKDLFLIKEIFLYTRMFLGYQRTQTIVTMAIVCEDSVKLHYNNFSSKLLIAVVNQKHNSIKSQFISDYTKRY